MARAPGWAAGGSVAENSGAVFHRRSHGISVASLRAVLMGLAVFSLSGWIGHAQPLLNIIGGGTGGVPVGVNSLSIGLSQQTPGAGGPLVVDSTGNLYTVASNRVYRIDTSGHASVVAGTGAIGFSDGAGSALNAQFGSISGLAIDTDGSLYIADFVNLCVWKVNVNNSTIVRFAGVGFPNATLGADAGGYFITTIGSGDGGPAGQAGLASPLALALDHHGSLYILTGFQYDLATGGIRKVSTSSGIISTFTFTDSTLNFNLVDAQFNSMAIDPTGTYLYLAGSTGASAGPARVNLCTGQVTATSLPQGLLTVDSQSNVYVLATAQPRGIYEAPGGAGSGTLLLDLSTFPSASVTSPGGIAVDSSNNVYFSYSAIWKTNTAGATPSLYAGDQSLDYNGDGISAVTATFGAPAGLAADRNGNVYVADSGNSRIRKINLATGQVSTVAGTSVSGYNGDGQGTTSELNNPSCLALDSSGQNLYIADVGNNRIRQLNLASGQISTLVGPNNAPARFSPSCIALDGIGNLYVLESALDNDQVDKVPLSGGPISQLPPIAAYFNLYAIAADSIGNVYVSAQTYGIYRYSGGGWTFWAGTGNYGDSGDGGPVSVATFTHILAMAYDGQGNLFLSDIGNGRIRRISLADNIVHAVTFDPGPVSYVPPSQYWPANGQPLSCAIIAAQGLAADGKGNLFFTDNFYLADNGLILEGANWAAAPAATTAETIGVSPANQGLSVALNGASLGSGATQSLAPGSYTLSAQATQVGQDGLTYSFVAWSDGNTNPVRQVAVGACPATYTALYSEPSCQLSLSSAGATVDSSVSADYFYVNTPPGSNCSWTARTSDPWIALKAGSGTGSGVVSFSLIANPTSNPRTGTITVGSAAYSLTQVPNGDCSYNLVSVPSSAFLPASGGSGSVAIQTQCFNITPPSSSASWLHITSGADSFTVTYSADSYTGATPRTGTLTVQGMPFTVTQEPPGVELVLSSSAVTVPPDGAAGSIAATLIDPNAACTAWTASASAPWITVILPAAGTPESGSGLVNYTVSANNTGASRQGTITVTGVSAPVTVTQPSGSCTFSLTSETAEVPAGGGPGSFGLTASDPFCFWSAVSSAPWLTLTSASTGSGSATLQFSAAAETAGPRSATVSVGGQVLLVVQGGFPVSIQTVPAGLQVNAGGSSAVPYVILPPGPATLTVPTPQAGAAGTQYVFTGWADGSTDNPRMINVSGTASYTAQFQTQYQLTATVAPPGSGSVTPAGGYYNAGTSVSVSATPNAGHQFVSWKGNVAAPSNATTTVTMSAPEALVANFSGLTAVAIQTNPNGLQFTLDGGSAMMAPQTLYLAPGSQHTLSVPGTQAGSSGTQYVFSSWSDGNTSTSRAITVTSSAATYTASFQTQYLLTISALPAAGGTVTPAASGYYNAGTSVSISAAPATGYSFSGWTGSVAAPSSAATTIAMSGPETVAANFSSIATSCSLTLSPAASLPPTGTSTVETCPNNSGQPNCGVLPEAPRSFTVTPSVGCGAWTATSSNPAFLQITSGAAGNGAGAVSFVRLNNTHTTQQGDTINVTSGTASASYAVAETGSGDSQVYREVYALYEQLLGRDPDSGGFGFWTGAGGAELGQMADSFLTSPEAFNSDFAVMAAYQAASGAPPTFAQYTAAGASIRAGTSLGGLFNSLIGGSYTAGTLYQNLLDRQPTGAEITAATNAGLANWFETLIGYPGSVTPMSTPNNEFQSTGTFHMDHTNALYVQMVYYVTLNRDPDPDGFAFWLSVANNGGPGILFQGAAGFPTRTQILGPGTPNQGFIGSPEFQGLFAN